MKTTEQFWRITVNYHKLKQVLVPIATAVFNVVSLQEQFNTASECGMCPLILQMHSFPFLSGISNGSGLHSQEMNNVLHL